jgi:6-phosphogluconate dehydrogenase
MQLGLIGLGRMGFNMGMRWVKGGHEIHAYNRTYAKTEELAKEGAKPAKSLKELVQALKAPRVVWLMLPTGQITNEHIDELAQLLSPGDLLIDGGNTYYKDDLLHAEQLAKKKIEFMDAGVSGGVWGFKLGYCTMVGGDEKNFKRIEPLLKTLAPKDGYLYCGNIGGGHFVKMVHNGIEYGLMQAYAEGFEILQASPYKPDSGKVAHLWNQGSVVRSWLLELAEEAFRIDAKLDKVSGYVEDSGEGRWTVIQAIESGVASPVIAQALFQRFMSRQENAFSLRVLAALRNQFGGHAVFSPDKAAREKSAGAGSVKPATAAKGAKAR